MAEWQCRLTRTFVSYAVLTTIMTNDVGGSSLSARSSAMCECTRSRPTARVRSPPNTYELVARSQPSRLQSESALGVLLRVYPSTLQRYAPMNGIPVFLAQRWGVCRRPYGAVGAQYHRMCRSARRRTQLGYSPGCAQCRHASSRQGLAAQASSCTRRLPGRRGMLSVVCCVLQPSICTC